MSNDHTLTRPFEALALDGERGLRLVGELDLQSTPQLTKALADMPPTGQAKLDVRDLTFIDSTGLHAIVEFARAQNGDGRVILDGVSPMFLRILEITDLAEHPDFDIRAAAGDE